MKETSGFTYSHGARHQIALVEDEDEVLVGRLSLEILFDAPTPRSQRVSRVEDMEDDVARVQHLVQFVPVRKSAYQPRPPPAGSDIPYPLRTALAKDGLHRQVRPIIALSP